MLKAHSPEYGDFIVLNELQLRYDGNMPRRMRAYTALVEEKYGLLVYPVVVNILQPRTTETVPSHYESEIMGCRAYQDYRVINLWEIEAETVFEQNLSSLLPFVPILKGGNSEANLRQALLSLRQDEVLKDLEPLLSFFASFVFDIPLVQQMMRWDMTVLQESPWYNEILKEGLQKGRQEGEVSLVLRLLTRRFGLLSEQRTEQIRQLSVPQLQDLGEALLEFEGMTDLEQYLFRLDP